MLEIDRYQKDLEELLSGIGLALVELNISRNRGSTQVRAVIYSPTGTGIDQCSKAHKLILPRLQVLLNEEDFHLEVASPGVDRWIRSEREYSIFAGRGVKVLLRDEKEWLGGRIVQAYSAAVTIRGPSGEQTVEYGAIAKARLDYAQEGV
jgi:ribosome maturation factor RimP